jgi:hypothetical protein
MKIKVWEESREEEISRRAHRRNDRRVLSSSKCSLLENEQSKESSDPQIIIEYEDETPDALSLKVNQSTGKIGCIDFK